MSKILVVDDESSIRFAFEQFLEDEGCTPLLAPNAEKALELIEQESPDIVFLDYRLPGRDGLGLLEEIQATDRTVAVVFMTAFGAMDVAIKAMQLGAYEYLTKPLDLDKIRVLIRRILEGKKNLKDLITEKDDSGSQPSLDQMVGKGPAMQEIFKMIGLLTTRDVTVLITGESGVGKELVARAIHENGPRCENPFVAVNCGAMPENLLEAEMFGHEKGAFTGADARKMGKFEVADGGTIFLDEIGELHLPLQVKLLRVLQEKTFEHIGGNGSIQTDARIIAATNKDLGEEVRAGRFRKDLFYRLHLVHIHLPPLRERREDIPLLVEHFIQKADREMDRDVRGVTEEAMKRLVSQPWPGNVRELENQIKRAMVVSREDILPEHLFEPEDALPPLTEMSSEERLESAARQAFRETVFAAQPSTSLFEDVVSLVERALIQEALHKTGGNQLQAAALLGMNRSTLRKKIKGFRI